MNQTPIASPMPGVAPYVDDGFDEFRARVAANFSDALAAPGGALFNTNAANLFHVYLDGSPSLSERKVRDCHACRRFIDVFGGLVTIDHLGHQRSALWSPTDVPMAYRDAARSLAGVVSKARVESVFHSSERILGHAVMGVRKDDPRELWTHFSVAIPPSEVWRSKVLDASQAMAQSIQDYDMLTRGLAEFEVEHFRKAHAMLTSEALFRSEKHEGLAKWLLDLRESIASARGTRGNLIWRAVAAAPSGWCHIRSGMIGTLLVDLKDGLPIETVKRRWGEKMHPLQYQRPQAAPTVGQIVQAEKLVEKLGVARALERRFAKLVDVQTIWTPRAPKTPQATPAPGVFGHLRPDARPAPLIASENVQLMTFEKFARVVLPEAEQIDLFVEPKLDAFVAYVTAQHADAPPVLQWDREELRNPVSLYTYVNGSFAHAWNVPTGWCTVTAITLRPSQWDPERTYDHHGKGVLFVLKGARDVMYQRGAGLFPENVRTDLHPVRSVIEAHARTAVIADKEGAEVCGLFSAASGTPWNRKVRVTARGVVSTYKLDRWD